MLTNRTGPEKSCLKERCPAFRNTVVKIAGQSLCGVLRTFNSYACKPSIEPQPGCGTVLVIPGGMLRKSILFCILPGNRTAGQRLEQLAKKVRTSIPVHVVRQVDDARATLLYRSEKIGVAVLFAATRQELLDLKSISSLLQDMRTILILPDGEEETIAVAHTMRPRFITCGDRDFRDVVAVLEKMTGISIENGSTQT
jgi:hypothetical protein